MPDSGSAPAIYPARPTISVDGAEQPALSDGLQTMLVEETAGGLYRCELTVGNYGPTRGTVGYLYFDRQLLDFGKSLRIEAGAGEGRGTIFEGRISAMEGRYFTERAPELLLLAEDRLQDLRMTRRTRTFADVSDSDLFSQVASAHSLQPQVDVSGGRHDVLAQLNQSDLAFVRERARAIDAEVWVEGTTLHVQARARRRRGTLTLSYRQGLHEMTAMADLAGQVSGFQVSGWDVRGKQGIAYRAGESAIAGELSGGTGGSAVLGRALGTRDQQVVHEMPVTQQEAQALAEAYYRRAARRFVTGRGIAEGDARIHVGAKLELRELGAMFDGAYDVVLASHTFDQAHGYRTAFGVERPGVGR
jgi:uncharacterized protein